jgi:hypothetical protein
MAGEVGWQDLKSGGGAKYISTPPPKPKFKPSKPLTTRGTLDHH